MLTTEIMKQIKKIEPEIINIRHEIHQNPELAYKEEETAKLITQKLKSFGLEVETNVFKTGVCGLLETSKPGKTIMLRADMDALPIQEKTNLEYASENEGVMHACGHDAHVAIILGAAAVLSKLKDKFKGNIKFVFQPAEEGEEGGAEGMISQGVLKAPKVDAALGLHVWGSVPKGIIKCKPGSFMASSDRFIFKVLGKGGHASQPQNCNDPIPIVSQVITGLQRIVSRELNPIDSAVVSVCHLEAGENHNIIPNEVLAEGTVRALKSKIRQKIPLLIEEVIKSETALKGFDYDFEFFYRYPAVINNEKMTDLVKRSTKKILGNNRFEEAKEPSMAGEDFSYFAREVPSCFFFLGIAPSEFELIQHHQPKFVVDDDVLKDGVGVLAQAAVDFLNN